MSILHLLRLLTLAAACVVSDGSLASEPRLEDYPAVASPEGKRPTLKLGKAEWTYRTRLRNAYREPVNFAGHFVVATWGCGTSCVMGAAIDVRTGRVTPLPGSVCCSRDPSPDSNPVQFKPDSRLVLLSGAINDDESTLGKHFYEITPGGFRLVGRFLSGGGTEPASPTVSSTDPATPPTFGEADAIFRRATLEERLRLQLSLTAGGYLNAIPNVDFSVRLFNAIKRAQEELNLVPDGIPTQPFLDRLEPAANRMLELWGFRVVSHPVRNRKLWIPLGLGLIETHAPWGVAYNDPRQRISVRYGYFSNTPLTRAYEQVVGSAARDGVVHYKLLRDSWFVVSSSDRGGTDSYSRYHEDGTGVIGFRALWKNSNGNISGERIAILMSGAISAEMSGTPFTSPTSKSPSGSVPAPQGTPVEVPPAEASPRTDGGGERPAQRSPAPAQSGTGFFVSSDGLLVTNAHVVEKCSVIKIRRDNDSTVGAQVTARDYQNDLALLRTGASVASFARLRFGVRQGETVAAFGFPHAYLLSTSGNFTVGHVTALSGLKDDSRQLQISAPVQSGNSGGPLLDMTGAVVGVVTSKLNALRLATQVGDLPQNVNFAIKSNILASFLESSRVAYQLSESDTRRESAEIADLARSFSAFIECTQ